MWKRVFLVGLILIFLSGCSMQTNQTEKLQDLEYTIVEEADLPEELRTILEEKKMRQRCHNSAPVLCHTGDVYENTAASLIFFWTFFQER